jgi:hypothetical protein
MMDRSSVLASRIYNIVSRDMIYNFKFKLADKKIENLRYWYDIFIERMWYENINDVNIQTKFFILP